MSIHIAKFRMGRCQSCRFPINKNIKSCRTCTLLKEAGYDLAQLKEKEKMNIFLINCLEDHLGVQTHSLNMLYNTCPWFGDEEEEEE